MVNFEKIKELAAAQKTNIREAEEAAGLSNGTIGKWRKANPKAENLKKVADYFGVQIEELLTCK